jgi:dihydrodipicolinate synthase/N-acetylneuraminate lyase
MDMIVYNIPSCTGSVIPIEVVCEMANRKWTQCCKDSSDDMKYLVRLISEAGPLGMRILIGSEKHAAEALLKGAHGQCVGEMIFCVLEPQYAAQDPWFGHNI